MATYVLAMYDIRAKQNFIFRTNKIKEIVGGSCIIRDCFKDYLKKASIEYSKTIFGNDLVSPMGIYNYKDAFVEINEISEKAFDPVIRMNELTTLIKNKEGEKKKEKDKAKQKEIDKKIKELKKEKEQLKRGKAKEDKAVERQNSGKFLISEFRKRLDNGYLGEVVYDGGGNFFVLYKNEDICLGINKIMTKMILEEIGTLKVLCTHIEVDGNLQDWKSDSVEIRKKHQLLESMESTIMPFNGSSITAVDPNTSMPLVVDLKEYNDWRFAENVRRYGVDGRVSRESFAKLKKYNEEIRDKSSEYGERVLDNLVKEEDNSLLAVVYIDGNNMGAYVENSMKVGGKEIKPDYETRINRLREVSEKIQTDYVMKRKANIEKRLQEKSGQSDNKTNRFVVFAGDEMSFIVKAKDALDAVEAYFEVDDNGKAKVSSCAGIAIFHSHSPYAEAYKIAEECCETGKSRMKSQKETETCYLDFQILQSGLGRDLETIRDAETDELISKPWLVNWGDNPNNSLTLKEIKVIAEELNLLGSRSNVKILAERAKRSLAEFDLEMERIYAHQSKEVQGKVKHLFLEMSGEERRRRVYDIVMAYDLWFRKTENSEKEGNA